MILKACREKRVGITQLEMSRRLGVSLGTVRAWEQNLNVVKTQDLIEISRAYRMTTKEFLSYLKQCSNSKTVNYNL